MAIAVAPMGLSQSATPISPEQIDSTVASAMKAFQVPGVAVGIVKDGKLIFAKGYGAREVGKPGRIDADTLFQIGSNTKAFTAAALAILVDEGKLHWDDKVIDHLPQFRLYDPYVTREFTIRDLLTHRSGLGLGAGDLMFFPATDMTRGEIIHGLRYLKPQRASAPRTPMTICCTWWPARSFLQSPDNRGRISSPIGFSDRCTWRPARQAMGASRIEAIWPHRMS